MKTLLAATMSGSSADPHPSVSSLPISSMSLARRPSVDSVECPKCGKRSIVERSSNIFDCLNCSFHRELPPVSGSAAGASRLQGGHHRPANPTLSPSRSDALRSNRGQLSNLARRVSLAHSDDETMADSLKKGTVSSLYQGHRHERSQGHSLSQRNSLNALLSSETHRASLEHLSLDMGEEMAEPDKSQPWIFALIAVVFGIILL